MRPPLKVVLFDLDGTLFDSVALLLACMRYAFEGFAGGQPVESDWIAGIGTPLITQLRAYARDDAEAEALRMRYREFQHREHRRMARAFPDSVPVLQELQRRGLVCGLVTSNGVALAQESLEFTGMAPFMRVVVGAETVTEHKPLPAPVLHALRALGARPEEAIFVGDSPHDIYAGNAAGTETVAALWGPFTRAQLEPSAPTYFLDRLADLPALLDRR